jgi:hypothetical protein
MPIEGDGQNAGFRGLSFSSQFARVGWAGSAALTECAALPELRAHIRSDRSEALSALPSYSREPGKTAKSALSGMPCRT